MANVFDNDNKSSDSNLLGTIFSSVVTLFALIGAIALLFIIPIILIINAIAAFITAAKYAKNPEDGAAKVANKLPGKISMVLIFMLLQCVIPGMSPAGGLTALTVVIILSTVLNFVASRLREYPAKQFKYLNVLQGGALVGIIGFLVFFFNLIKTGVFKSFVSGAYMYVLALQSAAKEVDTSVIVSGVLMIVYLCIALGCAGYLNKAARRLSCTVKRERPSGLIGKLFTPKASDNNVVSAVLSLLLFIIPTYVAGVEIEKIELLKLKSAQESALTGVLIGVIIMVIAEVAVIVLRKKFCADLSESEAEELMMGVAMTSEEQLAEAKKIVAEAEAAEAAKAAAEAPAAEAAPAEEAPAEEATEEVTK